jgi:hypothetical protein
MSRAAFSVVMYGSRSADFAEHCSATLRATASRVCSAFASAGVYAGAGCLISLAVSPQETGELAPTPRGSKLTTLYFSPTSGGSELHTCLATPMPGSPGPPGFTTSVRSALASPTMESVSVIRRPFGFL